MATKDVYLTENEVGRIMDGRLFESPVLEMFGMFIAGISFEKDSPELIIENSEGVQTRFKPEYSYRVYDDIPSYIGGGFRSTGKEIRYNGDLVLYLDQDGFVTVEDEE